MTKRCSKCRETQELSEFYKDRRCSDGRGSWCKSCFREQYQASKHVRLVRRQELYFADVEASRAASKVYREANKEALAAAQRKLKYGISAEQYAEMVARQKGQCAICEAPPGIKGLCIDHCHETGAVRALLCGNCNMAIGKLRDDPRIMRAAADYVEAHQTRLLPEGSPHDGQEEGPLCW